MPHKLYGNRKPGPNPYTEVRVTTHYDRIEIAYLSTRLKNWRNGTSFQNATLVGYSIRDRIDEDFPDYVDYIIKSMGTVLVMHDSRIPNENKLVTDYRNLASEWIWISYTEMRALSPTQRNHGKILQTYLERPYDYELIPPFVNAQGEPRYTRKVFKPRTDSGTPSNDP